MSNSIYEPIYGSKAKIPHSTSSMPLFSSQAPSPPAAIPPAAPVPPPSFPIKKSSKLQGLDNWTSNQWILLAVGIIVVVFLIVWLYLEKKRKDSLLKKISRDLKALRKYRG